MRKLISFMHTSLDGFVAGPNGEMNWINVGDEMFDQARERTNNADTALYARKTFGIMEAYWPTAADTPGASKHDIEHSTWYNSVHKLVVSKTLKAEDFTNTTIISSDLEAKISELKQQPGKEIIMFGSPSLVRLFTRLDLIDDYWLFVNPFILGEGIPLFEGAKNKKLKLVKSLAFSSGVICLHYEKLNNI